MIVVDTDVISYFWLRMTTGRSDAAQTVRMQDADWAVPRLWRSEFRSVLRGYMNRELMTRDEALRYAKRAQRDLQGREYEVSFADVLRLVEAPGHSAYDCEYVVLPRQLEVSLVTGDRQVVEQFPETAVLLDDYASGAVEDG